jgi:ferric-dicitrate binding protein FerR (iron transport regulator)
MPRIVAVVGQSSATPGGDGPRGEVRAGFEVPAGSLLETGGDGRLALRLSTGASLRLDVRTRIEIASDRSLALLAGAVYIDSGSPGAPAGPADGVEIHTPAGLVREIGTQFEVRLTDAAVRLRVREGMVTVDRPAGRLEVTSGRELRVDGDGSTGVRDLPPHGEDWAWIEAITPLMEIEGRSLREFLDWMARERGLGIRFAAGDLEAAAADIRLKGSIAGMSLDQALESVLMTCRMRPRIAGDLLIVERLDGTPGTS